MVGKFVLNLVKLVLCGIVVSLFIAFIGCGAGTAATPTSGVVAPNNTNDETDDGNGGGVEEQDVSSVPDDGKNDDNQPTPPVPMVFFIEGRYNVGDNEPTGGGSDERKLDRPGGVTTAEVGGMTYFFVAGRDDDGFSMFRIENDGALINTTNVSDTGSVNDGDADSLKLDQANLPVSGVATAKVGGTTYLFVTGSTDKGFSVFSVADDGTLMNTTNVSDTGSINDRNANTLKLEGAAGVATAEIDEKHYLFVTGFRDSGFSVFRIENDGTVINTENVYNSSTLELFGAEEVTTAKVGGTTYLFVAGSSDNGVSVFRVAGNGTVMNTANVMDTGTRNDGKSDTLKLNQAGGVTTVEVGGTTYFFVTGYRDNGFSMFSIENNGMLDNVTNVSDGGDLEILGTSGVTTAEVGEKHYLFVTGAVDDGFSVFSIENDGMLDNVTNVSDDGPNGILEINGASRITTVEVDGKHYLLVAGAVDDGVSVFEFGLRPVSSP